MDRTILDSFSALCWSVASPFAYKMLLAAQRGDWVWLTSQDVKPASYTCPHAYYGDAQVAAYLSKYPDFDLGKDKKAVAEDTFYIAERQCYWTNERLNPLLEDPAFYGERIKEFVLTWKRIIKHTLGPVPDYSCLEKGRFGPGSTYANVGDLITLADKLDDSYTCSESVTSLLGFWGPTAWSRHAATGGWVVGGNNPAELSELTYSNDSAHAHRRFLVVPGNRFTTVPKNAKTDRGICIEPSLNVFFQLGVGGEISRLLKRSFGWDKRTCQPHHQRLARIASLTGACATIDLSNASDTVSSKLVQLLLPPCWFSLLNQLRSTKTLIGNKWVILEKFSSMGNGFTFELETLIFRTLVETVRRLEGIHEDPYTPGLDVSVFGDDIIVPTSISKSAVSALKFFGFTPNEKKTFLKGPFRESCGGDYYRGYDVRPHYVRKDVTDPSELIALANGIRRFRKRYEVTGWWLSTKTVKIWHVVLNAIPAAISRCRGPEALGDLVIHDDESVWRKVTLTRNSVRYLRVWRPVANRVKPWMYYRPGVVMACALYGVPSGTPQIVPGADVNESWRRSGVVPRVNGSFISGYRFGRVAYS